ncbi:imm11 family protein [Cytobacillus sp. IB215316]|uniref:imm11 family protein n=1 Tax=Cytobacillus sp. IB215316 TaxID=3097354 RepID=UPI002A0F0165|nr:hypothetical protein [Cytobacillus sp. IB215316]MDX8363431.1 hypothetical protein [Cytobacillus sp. IB215316]
MKVYTLRENYDRFIEEYEYDAYSIPFEGEEELGSNVMGISEVELPKIIYCTADFRFLPHKTDYPRVDFNAPVFSKKMLEVFLELGEIQFRSVPVIMVDDSYLDDPFKGDGTLKDVVNWIEYLLVQLTEYTNVFDYGKSEFDECIVFPGDVGVVHKLVLKEPKGGFPPIFKVEECEEYIFISFEAKKALEKAGVKGCEFEPVEVS